jgi:hypothetical protein
LFSTQGQQGSISVLQLLREIHNGDAGQRLEFGFFVVFGVLPISVDGVAACNGQAQAAQQQGHPLAL